MYRKCPFRDVSVILCTVNLFIIISATEKLEKNKTNSNEWGRSGADPGLWKGGAGTCTWCCLGSRYAPGRSGIRCLAPHVKREASFLYGFSWKLTLMEPLQKWYSRNKAISLQRGQAEFKPNWSFLSVRSAWNLICKISHNSSLLHTFVSVVKRHSPTLYRFC